MTTHTLPDASPSALASLRADWELLLSCGIAPLQRWGIGSLQFDQLPRACSDDAVCGTLVEAAQAGDQVAGRVVLQGLLPRLRGYAARDPRHGVDEYVSAAWLRIMSHPIATRRRAVLVNLALDSLKSLSRSNRPRELPMGVLPEESPEPPEPTPTARAVIREAQRLDLVSAQTAAVLISIYADGLSGRQTAQLHQLSETTVRYRCSSAARKMRSHASELLAA